MNKYLTSQKILDFKDVLDAEMLECEDHENERLVDLCEIDQLLDNYYLTHISNPLNKK